MILDTPTKVLRLVLGEAKTTSDCNVVASYADFSLDASFFMWGNQNENTNGTTPVIVTASPLQNFQRQIKEVRLFNNDTVNHTVTLQLYDGTNTWIIAPSGMSIPPGGAFVYTPESASSSASLIVIGTTTISGGVNGDLLYNNAGVIGNESLASLLTSPPAIGGTTPAAAAFTVVDVNSKNFVPAYDYPGTTAGATFIGVLGSSGTPDTTQDAALIIQKWSASTAVTGIHASAYFSNVQTVDTAGTSAVSTFSETLQTQSWNGIGNNPFIEGGRDHARLASGTKLGSAYARVNSAIETDNTVTHTYLVAEEDELYVFSKDAGSTLSATSFAANIVISSSGTKHPDAGIVINPYIGASNSDAAAVRTGIYLPAGAGAATQPVSESFIRCDASPSYVVNALNAPANTITSIIAAPSNTPIIKAMNNAGNAKYDVLVTDNTDSVYLGTGAVQTQVGGPGGNVVFSASTYCRPVPDNVISMGDSLHRFTAYWGVNGAIQTSDPRLKTGITPLPSMLPILDAIEPYSFKWISGGFVTEMQDVEQEVHATEEVEKEIGSVEDVNGVPTWIVKTVKTATLLYDDVPVLNVDGTPAMVTTRAVPAKIIDAQPAIIDGLGKVLREAIPERVIQEAIPSRTAQRTIRKPRMVKQIVPTAVQVEHPGRRLHAGFLAPDWKAAFDAIGMDWGGYVKAGDGTESLRPDQVIPVLWRVAKELRSKVAALEAVKP